MTSQSPRFPQYTAESACSKFFDAATKPTLAWPQRRSVQSRVTDLGGLQAGEEALSKTSDDRFEPKVQNSASCMDGWDARFADIVACKVGPVLTLTMKTNTAVQHPESRHCSATESQSYVNG